MKLCAILLYAEGYRPENANAHYRTIDSLSEILGEKYRSDSEYLNSCRSTRNTLEYEHVGQVNESDIQELIEFVDELRTSAMDHLKRHHPELLP